MLEIECLLDTGCKVVANMIKGKSTEEIRKTFNIINDFTPEEEEQIRRENEWVVGELIFQKLFQSRDIPREAYVSPFRRFVRKH